MSTLRSYRDGSLGSGPNMSAIKDGSLGALDMSAYKDGSLGSGPNMSAIKDGSLGALDMSAYQNGSLGGCGCGGLGQDEQGKTLTYVGIGIAALIGLYMVAEKKLLKA